MWLVKRVWGDPKSNLFIAIFQYSWQNFYFRHCGDKLAWAFYYVSVLMFQDKLLSFDQLNDRTNVYQPHVN